MKKIVTSAAALLLFSLMFFAGNNAKAQNSDAAWIGRARGVLSSCLSGYSSDFDIIGSVSYSTYPCFVAPCPTEITVTFIGGPKCAGNSICPLFVVFLGSVTFVDSGSNGGGNGDVIVTNCAH
jgi:hypothetical protein